MAIKVVSVLGNPGMGQKIADTKFSALPVHCHPIPAVVTGGLNNPDDSAVPGISGATGSVPGDSAGDRQAIHHRAGG